MKALGLIILLVFSLKSFGQKSDQLSQIHEQLREQQRMMRKLLEEGIFRDFDESFEKILKQFDQGSFGDMNKFFEPGEFEKFFDQANPFKHLRDGDIKWVETPTHRILVMNYASKGDSPLDIKIANGSVSIKGEMIQKTESERDGQKQYSEYRSIINRSVSIPDDVIAEKAEIKNDNGKISVHFPKKEISQDAKVKNSTKKNEPKKVEPSIRPIQKDDNDISI